MAKYEGSPIDDKRDRAQAKKRGIPVSQWEGSPADKKQDAKYQAQMDRKERRPKRGPDEHESTEKYAHEGSTHTSKHR